MPVFLRIPDNGIFMKLKLKLFSTDSTDSVGQRRLASAGEKLERNNERRKRHRAITDRDLSDLFYSILPKVYHENLVLTLSLWVKS